MPNETDETIGQKAIRALLLLSSVASLADFVYDVREREGMGWDGPDVKTWSDGCVLAEEVIAAVRSPEVPA